MELLNFTPVPTRARHDGWSAADSANSNGWIPLRHYEHSRTFAWFGGLRVRASLG
jgi:hypothetical protein